MPSFVVDELRDYLRCGVLAAHSARRPHVVPQPDDEERYRPKNATFCELMKHGLGVDILACPCG
ncbi:MAG: hypothetical protein ACK5U8_12620, partial [Deltaproteobacteria bacterium]